MISMSFDGISFDCYQDPELDYSTHGKETLLYSGDTHVSLGSKVVSFPRSYLCYTESFTVITSLIAKMAAKTFGTLTVGSETFTDCYIYHNSGIGAVHEVTRGSGKWTYTMKFGQADQY